MATALFHVALLQLTPTHARTDAAIRVVRARPGDHAVCQALATTAIKAFYGQHHPLQGPLMYVQRSIIYTDVLSDLSARLRFYEEARERGLKHRGAVFMAMDGDSICGFADVGLTLYNSHSRSFSLPKRPEGNLPRHPELFSASPFANTPTSTYECRPYLSNLAVNPLHQRRGIGRFLVEACEAEARRWGGDYRDVWLEVSLHNTGAIDFYEALGYEQDVQTTGREVICRRFSFESIEVRRRVLRKPLTPEPNDSKASVSTLEALV